MRNNMYLLISQVLLLIYTCSGADFMTKNADNYGPYYVEWEHYDPCRGPKLANLTTFTTTLEKLDNDIYRGILNVTFPEQTRVDEMKLSVYSIKNNGKNLLYNYMISKPCQHYMFAAFLEMQLKVRNCVVKKGDYFMDLNLTALMSTFLGSSFFYGDYYFKVLVMSKKGNIVCLTFDPKLKKKVKNNS